MRASRRGGAPAPRGRSGSPRGRGAALAAAAALAGTLLVGCGGDDSPPEPTASSATPSATPSETPTAEPTTTTAPQAPARPRSRNTRKGREEFAAFVVARWGHALATNDAAAVTKLSPKGTVCQGCRELRTELARRAKQGWFVDFPGADVKRVDVRPGDAPGTWVATARISVPASRSYFEDGTYRNDNEARDKVPFTVRMRHQAGRFVLLGFSVG